LQAARLFRTWPIRRDRFDLDQLGDPDDPGFDTGGSGIRRGGFSAVGRRGLVATLPAHLLTGFPKE